MKQKIIQISLGEEETDKGHNDEIQKKLKPHLDEGYSVKQISTCFLSRVLAEDSSVCILTILFEK